LISIVLSSLAVLAACFPLAEDRASFIAQDHPPNLLLITIDTLRADHLGCYGYRSIQTPVIDSLAAEGILYENCIAQSPMTLPSHCTILTGTYPQFHGVRDNIAFSLDPKIPTIAEILKSRGYSTGGFVASYVLNHTRGLGKGFDKYFDNYDALAPDTSQFVAMLAETKGERIIQEAIQWMKSISPKPFFAWVHLYEPHDPYEPPEPYKSRYSRHPYDGEIAYTDSNLGKLFQFLRSSNLYERTWIFLAGDHGESLGEHQEDCHGYYIYDASLHVPLIIKGFTPELRGRRVSAQVRIVDIPSTIMAVVQSPSPGFQGREVLSLARDTGRAPALPAYSESFMPKLQFGWSELKSWRFGRYKYIEAPRPELYDLEKDPRETVNLLATQQAIANQYRQELARFYPLYQRSPDHAVPQSKLSPAELQRLQSLGYVGGSVTPIEAVQGEKLPDPKDKLPIYQFIQSILYSNRQQMSQAAAKRLEGLIRDEPRSATIYNFVGLNELRNGRFDSALANFKKAVSLAPDNSWLVYNLAFAYLQKEEFDKAITGFERCLQLDPSNGEAYTNLGNAWGRQGQSAKAKQYYQEAVRVSPTNKFAHYNLGQLEFNAGNTTAAINHFNRCIALDSKYVPAYLDLANAYLSQSQFDKAIPAFQKTIELDPSQAEAHYNLGLIYKKQGQWKMAAQSFARVVAANPEDAEAHYNLGLAYQQTGREAEGRRELEKACQLNPEACRQ